MSIIEDDPGEVLALLNALGFVGITAPQLKAFMKDLKLYRKVKERERQQRKEEIKNKIIQKQQSMMKEILEERNREYRSTENTVSTESSNRYDDSLIKVRIKCLSGDEEITGSKSSKENRSANTEELYAANAKPKVVRVSRVTESRKHSCDYDRIESGSVKHVRSENDPSERAKTNICTGKKDRVACSYGEKPVPAEPQNNFAPPNSPSKERAREQVVSARTRSASSTRNSTRSGSKSFIRPWRLQPGAQGTQSKKCDPVALYQKYQQEWKQISFPGEDKRGSIRWAVRERMLGTDPQPVPLPKKSTSMPVLKRK